MNTELKWHKHKTCKVGQLNGHTIGRVERTDNGRHFQALYKTTCEECGEKALGSSHWEHEADDLLQQHSNKHHKAEYLSKETATTITRLS